MYYRLLLVAGYCLPSYRNDQSTVILYSQEEFFFIPTCSVCEVMLIMLPTGVPHSFCRKHHIIMIHMPFFVILLLYPPLYTIDQKILDHNITSTVTLFAQNEVVVLTFAVLDVIVICYFSCDHYFQGYIVENFLHSRIHLVTF